MENIFDKLCIPLNFQLINKEPGHISMHLAGVVFFLVFFQFVESLGYQMTLETNKCF